MDRLRVSAVGEKKDWKNELGTRPGSCGNMWFPGHTRPSRNTLKAGAWKSWSSVLDGLALVAKTHGAWPWGQMKTSPGMGSLSRNGGSDGLSWRATGQVAGGRKMAVVLPVLELESQRVLSGRRPVVTPLCWVRRSAVSSAEMMRVYTVFSAWPRRTMESW